MYTMYMRVCMFAGKLSSGQVEVETDALLAYLGTLYDREVCVCVCVFFFCLSVCVFKYVYVRRLCHMCRVL